MSNSSQRYTAFLQPTAHTSPACFGILQLSILEIVEYGHTVFCNPEYLCNSTRLEPVKGTSAMVSIVH